MSQKTERPVLSGQRIKTRKRDEKEKYDPTGFRDAVIAGLQKAGGDLEAISKYLDIAGNKLDYRRYGEVLFDILIAGGLLVPGGSISQDGEMPSTDCCIFTASEDMESMRNQEQVFVKLMRRYKYLEKMFEEEMKKVLVFIKGFTPMERVKLARMTALWMGKKFFLILIKNWRPQEGIDVIVLISIVQSPKLNDKCMILSFKFYFILKIIKCLLTIFFLLTKFEIFINFFFLSF